MAFSVVGQFARVQEMLQDQLNVPRGESRSRNPHVCAK